LSLGLFEVRHPTKALVVCTQEERLSIQERTEVFHGFYDREELSARDAVVSFLRGKCLAIERDGAFESLLYLG
jgi:hypothetical protein